MLFLHYFSIFCFWLWHLLSYLSSVYYDRCLRSGPLDYAQVLFYYWLNNQYRVHGNSWISPFVFNATLSIYCCGCAMLGWIQLYNTHGAQGKKHTTIEIWNEWEQSSSMERKDKDTGTARTRQHFIALFRAPAIQSKRLDFFSRSPIVSYHIVFMCMKHIQCKPNTRTIETFEHGLCEKWNRIRSRGWTKNMKRKEYLCGMEMKRIAEKLCVFDRSINNMIWSRKYSWRAYKILKTIYLLGNLIVNFFIRSFTIIMKLRKFFTLNCKWFVILYVCVCLYEKVEIIHAIQRTMSLTMLCYVAVYDEGFEMEKRIWNGIHLQAFIDYYIICSLLTGTQSPSSSPPLPTPASDNNRLCT